MSNDAQQFTAGEGDAGSALAGFLRERLEGLSWNQVKRLVTTGKVTVDGVRASDPGQRLRAGQLVALSMTAPRPDRVRNRVEVLHLDDHIAVILKPAGLASVPYADQEPDNALEAVRQLTRRRGQSDRHVEIVHRLDKATSGVMVFPLSHRARTVLGEQFRAHTITRRYRCVAHGHPEPGRIESWLVQDRGDGLRGSGAPEQGKLAISHLSVVEALPLASVCDVRLETGRTHQIRVHLSERGHPLVGEPVYIRDFVRQGGTPLRCARLMLHAAELGFEHPRSGKPMHFEVAPDAQFEAELEKLRG